MSVSPSHPSCLPSPSRHFFPMARVVFPPGLMRRRLLWPAVLFLALGAAACKEEGSIKVHKLDFKGVTAVDASRLKAALATHQSSKIPWGKKAFFDRTRFDADLKRIQA